MAQFDWGEYKEFKSMSNKEDKLLIAIDFMRSYYNMNSPRELYHMLYEDDIGRLMLKKRDISDMEKLEDFMYRS